MLHFLWIIEKYFSCYFIPDVRFSGILLNPDYDDDILPDTIRDTFYFDNFM